MMRYTGATSVTTVVVLLAVLTLAVGSCRSLSRRSLARHGRLAWATLPAVDTRPIEPSAEDLTTMAAGELYWSAIAPIWETASVFSSPDAFLSQFARVTEAQGLVLAARWCLSETLNGGFHQFFFNPTGVLAPEGVRGFKLLGIPDAASVVTAAMAKLGAAYPREQEVRRMHLGRISPRGTVGAASDPFDVLDRALQATTMDFVERADAFVRAHMALFFRSGAWRYFTHPDGRTWAIRQAPDGFELGIGGADPDDLPILRARRSCNPERDTEALVADAIADGFVPRPFFVP